MKSCPVGLFVLLALVAAAQSEKVCDIEGTSVVIPDSVDCDSYVHKRIESFRFPTFPWIRFPPILSTLLPLLPRWPTTTPSPDDDDDDDDDNECPETGVKQISHPDSCEKYILCLFGNAIERNCAEGLHFSRKTRNCVDPDIAGCKDDDGDMEWKCPKDADSLDVSFIPNTEDCSKYYVCFGGEQFPLSCPEGLHWSITEEMCDDKEKANCKFEDEDREFCPETGVKTISHPDKCEKYILCVGGNEIERSCPEGLHFSRESRACEDPEDAGCEDFDSKLKCPKEDNLDELVFLPNPEDCEKYFVCFMGEPIPLRCAEGNHWSPDDNICILEENSECKVEDDGEECPDSGVVSISHPTDCEMYILCVGGTRIKRSCAPGLHFSRKLGVCTQPDVAECEDPDKAEQCPDTGVISISHPTDCEMFILCVGGTRLKRNCAPGLHFSRKLGVCAQPDVAECEDPDDAEECPDSGVISISHPTDCEMYILCVGGTRIKRNCAPGLHFSRDLGSCVQPEIAECEAVKLTCPKEDDWSNIVFLPNKENCGKYYVCFQGEPIAMNCPIGFHWSTTLNNCVEPAIAECEFDDDSEQCPEEGIKSISHPDSCDMYILCMSGTRIKRSCAPGFHFSRIFRSCVQPHLAGCETEDGEEEVEEGYSCPAEDDILNLVFLPNTENCEKYYLCHRGEQFPFSCANNLHWNRRKDMCMTPEDAGCKHYALTFDCPSNEGIDYYHDPSDCQSYYVCDQGRQYKQVCDQGLLWNRTLKMCNSAESVECH